MLFNSYAAQEIARDKRKEARQQAENSRLSAAGRAGDNAEWQLVQFGAVAAAAVALVAVLL